jgi:broad specificity phosphatase PhoE
MGATQLWLVRHGESVANVAAAEAERAGLATIASDDRDADVRLSPTGREQAAALGSWLAEHAGEGRPSAVWASSYSRAKETIQIALRAAELDLPVRVDERLRDRELGVLDLLTSVGVEKRFPEEAARRRWLGKFYYRPPGGESWADVVLRLRSFLRDVDLYDDRGCVLVAAHDAVVLMFIYLCGGLDERDVLDFSQHHVVLNASVTRLSRPSGEGTWTMNSFSEVSHLATEDAPITSHPGNKNVDIH